MKLRKYNEADDYFVEALDRDDKTSISKINKADVLNSKK